MQKKQVLYTTKGMNRDLADSKATKEFAFENMNIRITPSDGNTLLTLVNEKGNTLINPTVENPYEETGDLDSRNILGYAILGSAAILFMKAEIGGGNYDGITKLEYNSTTGFKETYLYLGDLGFSLDYPIETLSLYESEDIQKVYWVDGLHQPRVININNIRLQGDASQFDFFSTIIATSGNIAVTRVTNSTGIFPGGTVQYFYTYANKNGHESQIVRLSKVNYTTFDNRAVSPEETTSASYRVDISDIGSNNAKFDYLKLYSIIRTGENSQPIVRLIQRFALGSGITYISYTDTNTTGEIVDPTLPLFIGGKNFKAGTITSKDNTLFLGNLTINTPRVPQSIRSALTDSVNISVESSAVQNWVKSSGYCSHINPITNYSNLTYLRAGNKYRLGLQFRKENEEWTNPEFVKDYLVPEFGITNGTVTTSTKPYLNGNNLYIPKFKFTIPGTLYEDLIELGYKEVRPVIVYPEEYERAVIAQGIVCPTVFKAGDRYNGNLFAGSSWFFRPFYEGIYDDTDDQSLEWRWLHPVKGNTKYTGEIQSQSTTDIIVSPREVPRGAEGDYTRFENSNDFYVDDSFMTFHSPDITSSLSDGNLANSTLKITGAFNIDTIAGRASINTSLGNGDSLVSKSTYDLSIALDSVSPIRRNILSSTNFIHGIYSGISTYAVNYPWHRNTTLVGRSSGTPPSYSSKVLSNLRSSQKFIFYDNSAIATAEGLVKSRVFRKADNDSFLKFDNFTHQRFDHPIYYAGNYNSLLVPSGGYTIKGSTTFEGTITDVTGTTYTDPISMKYKSTDHIVLQFDRFINDFTTRTFIVPDFLEGDADPHFSRPMWINMTLTKLSRDYDYSYKALPSISNNTPASLNYHKEIMWITELRREIPSNIFGGTSEYAKENNKWSICGRSVYFGNYTGGTAPDVDIEDGDTIFNRWDCVKTLPYSTEDKNQIVEVMSFMCESYVNTAGRYDNHIDDIDFTYLSSATEFNAINPAYFNKNNYFSFRVIDYKKALEKYPNKITWSKTKTLGENVDTWTSISLASILDLDGDKGGINALRKYKNLILAFQDKGISEVIFNPSIALTTSSGVPIELANSGKVEGKRYLSEDIGCTNKWSICTTQNGLYFIDSFQKKIYLLSDGIKCLSDSNGFNSWVSENITDSKSWTISSFNNMVTQYDKTVGDVYFITNDKCLAYNELLGTFTSFYSYNSSPFFINMDNKCISLHKEMDIITRTGVALWWQHNGEYNKFFGSSSYSPYYSEIIVNENPTLDKIFTNLDFRADSWKFQTSQWVLQDNTTFDSISVSNEYQSGTQALSFTRDTPSTLKKKFRIWRAELPRANNSRDRIRNPWAHIRLSKSTPSNEKTQLHDMVVTYYV